MGNVFSIPTHRFNHQYVFDRESIHIFWSMRDLERISSDRIRILTTFPILKISDDLPKFLLEIIDLTG